MTDVELLPTDGTVVKVNCALSERCRGSRGWATPTDPGPEHLGTITIAPSIAYLEKACDQAAAGEPADEFFCEAWIQTATEPELAPEGKHTLSVFAQYVPYALADGTWDERRDEIGDRVIASIERLRAGLTDLIEDRLVLGPPDLEERFGLTGGNIFHGEILPDWLFENGPRTRGIATGSRFPACTCAGRVPTPEAACAGPRAAAGPAPSWRTPPTAASD